MVSSGACLASRPVRSGSAPHGGLDARGIGNMAVEGPLESDQLAHIVDTVRGRRGFVHGYWGQAPYHMTQAHAFVVFADQRSGEAMAHGVAQAIPTASVVVVEPVATA
jgi:hypothetical protein